MQRLRKRGHLVTYVTDLTGESGELLTELLKLLTLRRAGGDEAYDTVGRDLGGCDGFADLTDGRSIRG